MVETLTDIIFVGFLSSLASFLPCNSAAGSENDILMLGLAFVLGVTAWFFIPLL